MGGTEVKQALPTKRVEQISPFLLLHHFGPYEVPAGLDPLDVTPHPHRGFEPVTFLYSGGIRHKDSRGNEGFLNAGDVQWMTAGRGIIHSEKASRDFRERGGRLEGIQLWVNLPQKYKMVQPRYQDVKKENIPLISEQEGAVRIKVVAGEIQEVKGPVETYTDLLALQVELRAGHQLTIDVPEAFHALSYILKGELESTNGFAYPQETLLNYAKDGKAVSLKALKDSQVLFLAGQPIDEPIAQWGPYVMNTQTEILEALRDYKMGKMGFLHDSE